MLLLVDLDNTLVDRDRAFRDAVAAFLAEHALPDGDLAWALGVDAGGSTSRPDVAAALTGRYGARVPEAAIRGLVDGGAARRVVLADAARDALSAAREQGWACVIVTNGRTVQQETKIRRTGLDRLVDGWVVSEAVGAAKPDPEIFRAAAALVGASPYEHTWVVGDSPQADIAGAYAFGALSVWIAHGRAWTEASYRPTHTAPDVAAAIRHVLRSGTQG